MIAKTNQASKKAFIRRYGKHSTRAKGERDWNHELATPALSVISDAFERTIAAVCDELRRSETLTLGRLDALAAKIQRKSCEKIDSLPLIFTRGQ